MQALLHAVKGDNVGCGEGLRSFGLLEGTGLSLALPVKACLANSAGCWAFTAARIARKPGDPVGKPSHSPILPRILSKEAHLWQSCFS